MGKRRRGQRKVEKEVGRERKMRGRGGEENKKLLRKKENKRGKKT